MWRLRAPTSTARAFEAIPALARAAIPALITAKRNNANALWNAPSVSRQRARIFLRQDIVDAVVRKVGEGGAKRRQLPVEHPDDARLDRVEHDVRQPKVAVDDRGWSRASHG